MVMYLGNIDAPFDTLLEQALKVLADRDRTGQLQFVMHLFKGKKTSHGTGSAHARDSLMGW